jgi:hypothetical protein
VGLNPSTFFYLINIILLIKTSVGTQKISLCGTYSFTNLQVEILEDLYPNNIGDDCILLQDSSNVTFVGGGYLVTGPSSDSTKAAFNVDSSCTGVTISNSAVTGTGVLAQDGMVNLTVNGCSFSGGLVGVVKTTSDPISVATVKGCKFTDVQSPISVTEAVVVLENNTITGALNYGFEVNCGGSSIISQNTVC